MFRLFALLVSMVSATRLYPGDHTGMLSEATRDSLLNEEGAMSLDQIIPDPMNLEESFHSRYEESPEELRDEQNLGIRHRRDVEVEVAEAQDVFEQAPGYGLQ